MRDAIETIEYKGFEIGLFLDEDAISPREWDNLGTMLCLYPHYDLGDKHNLDAGGIIEVIFGSIENYRAGKEPLPNIQALPLAVLNHSGLWMKVGSSWDCDPGGWDTSAVGYIYVPYEALRKEYGVKYITKSVLDKAEGVLRAEVEVYSDYLEGGVYGFVVEDRDGETLDSCWGYYGKRGWDDAIATAKGSIDSVVNTDLWRKALGPQLPLFVEMEVGV